MSKSPVDPSQPQAQAHPHAQALHALQAAMAALEAQRALLGNAVVDVAVAGLQGQLQALQIALAAPGTPATPDAAAAPPADADPEQALRLVSILFLDVVGSTALSQRLDPEEIHSVMDAALARFTTTVQAHGGRVLQYAGDNLLAGFGAGEVHEDDAERAVRCGLALLADGRRVGADVQAAHGHGGFDVRVGIHSGPVLLGGGVDAAGTIRGSAVNVAARMEQSAEPGTLLVSVDCYRLVEGRFDVHEGQTIRIKGIDAPMLTYRVDRERPRSAQAVRRGLDGATAALVGRDADLRQMHAALEAVLGQGLQQGVTLIGEAGLGKTRLVAEFEAALRVADPAITLLRAHAHLQGLHQPYGVIRDLLFRRFDVQDSDPLDVAQAKLAAGLAPLFGDRAQEQTALLGQLIGLDFSASPFIAGILQDGKQLRARAFHAWVEYLRLLCAPLQPPAVGVPTVVLMLDDLHWADDGSLDAIEHLASAGLDSAGPSESPSAGASTDLSADPSAARLPNSIPLLLLCAARPELLDRRPGWGADWPAHRLLALQPLDADDRQALARSLLSPLQQHPDAPSLQQLLIDRTDGNPFYMEALLQMLVDQGVLVTSTTPWQLATGGLQQLRVPTTLVGVLQARLDSLLAPQRRALQQASVVGAVFWDDALASLDARAPTELLALCQRALALPHESSAFGDTQEFAFRHHLLHEVTYGTVLKRDKREQHARAALWLEARSTGRGAEFAGLIAEHFERAGIPDRAAHHWSLAAQEAGARHADSAALAHADRALALGNGGDPQRKFALLRVRAVVWSRRGNVGEHKKAIEALEAQAEAQDDDVQRLIAAQTRMYRLCMDGAHEEAHLLGLRRLAAAEALSPAEAARTHNTLIMALGRQGRHEEARTHAEAALTLSRAVGDAYTEASALNNLSVGHLTQRHLTQATAYGEQALAVYQRIGSRYGAAIAMLNLAFAAQCSGQLALSRDQMLPLIQLCDAIDHQQIGAQARCNLASVLADLGDPQAALAHAQDGIRMAQKIGDSYIEATGHAAVAAASIGLGLWQRAIDHGRMAQAGLLANGERSEALFNEASVACALHQAGDSAAARVAVEAVLTTVANRGGWQDDEAEAAIACTRLLTIYQDPRAAATLAAAHGGLVVQAAALTDPVLRDQFLQATALRREIQAAWNGRSQALGA